MGVGYGMGLRRAWQPAAVFLPGKSHGQRSLAGYSQQGCKELDMTEATEDAWDGIRIEDGNEFKNGDGETFLVVQWLRLRDPNAGGQEQGTRSHMPQ